MTVLLQISDSGEITIPLDIIKKSGMYPGEIIEATIDGASVILRRSNSIDWENDKEIWKKNQERCMEETEFEDPPSRDLSPYFGSLKHVFAGRSAIEIGKQLRDDLIPLTEQYNGRYE